MVPCGSNRTSGKESWGHQCKGSRQNREDMTRIDRLDRYDCDDQEELRAIYYVRVTCTVTYFDFQTEYGLLLAETDGAFLH